MKSVSFSKAEFDQTLCYEAWSAIVQYRYFFYKVSRGDTDELMMKVFEHIMTHYKPECGELVPYMISLARSMSKRDGKIVPCDFLENTLSDALDKQASASGVSNDMVDSILDGLDTTEEKFISVAELALGHMNFFNLMCEALINKSSATRYFPEPYIKSCLALCKRCGGEQFNEICLHLYRKYKSKFNWFMSSSLEAEGSWRELDSGLINKNESKRVKIVKKGTDIPCKDPDIEEWEIKGTLGNKRVLKIPYKDIFNYIIDLIEEDGINPIKFTIGSSYICRSLGGSLSVVNVSLFSQYDIFKLELLTNLIYDLEARHMAVGSECVYMLASNEKDGSLKKVPKRVVRGITLDFDVIDVTPFCEKSSD